MKNMSGVMSFGQLNEEMERAALAETQRRAKEKEAHDARRKAETVALSSQALPKEEVTEASALEPGEVNDPFRTIDMIPRVRNFCIVAWDALPEGVRKEKVLSQLMQNAGMKEEGVADKGAFQIMGAEEAVPK